MLQLMNWKKIGKIIDPTTFQLHNGCTEFAQSPQTLVFDDYVRIYFSTRQKTENGKYISHIAFVDVDKNFEIINQNNEPIIELGALGTFDEHGIFPINLLRNGNQVYAYTCGWSRRTSVSVETGIGLAISHNNGVTFTKVGNGPIVSASLYEPVLVGDAFVQQYNNQYHMWYIYGTKWMPATTTEPEARVYKIAYATSINGINWTKQEGVQIISDVLNPNECQALPTVTKVHNTYHMYFCFREATDFRNNATRGYKLGYAYSTDLVNWTRNDALKGIETTPNSWDSEMMCYPHIFQAFNQVYLLYNGNHFGKYGFGIAQLQSI